MAYKICAFADEASNELSGQIRTLNERKIHYIELRNLDGKNVAELSVSEARDIQKRLADKGISVWSIGSRLGKIGVFDDMDSHLEELRHTLELAHALDCSNIRMFSFYIPADKSAEECKGEVFERIGKMLDVSRGSGITLCHENEKGIYGDIAPRCLELAREFGELKLVFDPANFVQCKQDTLEAWESLKPYVSYLHIKDALEDGRIVPAGNGKGRLAQVIADYGALGGEVLTLEPHLTLFEGLSALENRAIAKEEFPFEYASAAEAFGAAHEALKKIIE